MGISQSLFPVYAASSFLGSYSASELSASSSGSGTTPATSYLFGQAHVSHYTGLHVDGPTSGLRPPLAPALEFDLPVGTGVTPHGAKSNSSRLKVSPNPRPERRIND